MSPEELRKHTDELLSIVAHSETSDGIRAGQIGLWLAEEVKRLQLELSVRKCVQSPCI